MKNLFNEYYIETLKNRKYTTFYIVSMIIIFLSILDMNNYFHPKIEIIIFISVVILGIIFINFYFKNSCELYKFAFVLILSFGIICSFLTPICDVCDEQEHLVRSEITSQGILFPEFHEGKGFLTIQSVVNLCDNIMKSVFETNIDNQNINHTPVYYSSSFTQNPFYGYLAQGFGVFLAKIFNLNTIWILWLGRICNLVLYSFLVSFAVKKSPILKIPLIAIGAMPLAIYQGASMNIDSLINGLALVIIAYFFYLYESNEVIRKKDIILFSFLCLTLGLSKLPYSAFIFLIVFLPKNKFENQKLYYYGFLSILLLSIVGTVWSKYYATPALINSYRNSYFLEYNVNISLQIKYILSHIPETFIMIFKIPNYLGYIFKGFFSFSFKGNNYGSPFIEGIYPMFFGAICLLYPNKYKITKKTRILVFLVIYLIFTGTYMVQLLTWTPVGNLHSISGTQFRYFISLFPLLPFVFGLNNNIERNSKIDSIIIILIIIFSGSTLLSIVAFNY